MKKQEHFTLCNIKIVYKFARLRTCKAKIGKAGNKASKAFINCIIQKLFFRKLKKRDYKCFS